MQEGLENNNEVSKENVPSCENNNEYTAEDSVFAKVFLIGVLAVVALSVLMTVLISLGF